MKRNQIENKTLKYLKILITISILALCFHLLILIKLIPYEITWGGRLKNDNEMYVFEIISIAINLFFIYVLLQKGNLVKNVFNAKTLTLILWTFFFLFSFNTLGNIFAKTIIEKCFFVLTLINAILLWKINKTK